MRQVPLGHLNAGINRLRVKGDASAKQLYDLLNGFITSDGSVSVREGTIRAATLTSATVGLASMNGVFNVFGTSLQTVPSGYKCNVLAHPLDQTQTLKTIWFAKPFMGFMYVTAEFNNGDVYDYWLQNNGSWLANHVFKNGNIVEPTTPNGYGYLAVRDTLPNPTWASESTVAVNSKVEPTVYTGFSYQATTVLGAAPHTGSTEPTWPTVEGGTVQEFGDFGVSQTTAATGATTTGLPLGRAITDRYGNSAEIAGQIGTTTSGNAATVTAIGAVSTWAPGVLYAPGSVVKPSTGQGGFIGAIPNGDFEAGNNGAWILTGTGAFDTTHQYQGTTCVSLTSNNGSSFWKMNTHGAVLPGQSVTASAYVNPNNTGTDLHIFLELAFYDASDTFISMTKGPDNQNGGYRKTTVTAVAPANAAFARVWIESNNGTSSRTGYADLVVWNLETPAAVSNFLYEAVQAVAGSSGTTEPTWPVINGNTVIDNQVTWKAIGTSIITWTAVPLMKSGGSEPAWPTTPGLTIPDGTMSWQCVTRVIGDVNIPHTKATALGASHVFKGNVDICSFSAAVDPTDWTSASNAGYLPTGLNNYGDNPIAMLALYRGNLLAFNAGGYQMWQIDPDPANMALLDAQPVGSIWPKAAQSVSNDLLFLTEVGVRNLGTIGATANMQIGNSGQPVDALVKAQLMAGTYAPTSLYYPGRGQYWLIFGPQAFVFTVNGAGLKSWSRYVFPAAITGSTIMNGVLYLRSATNFVWQVDAATLVDDFGGANVNFPGVIQWPYLDLGSGALNEMLLGVDLVGTGAVTVQVGFLQSDPTTFSDNAGFATSLNVTAPYLVSDADTVPGMPIPLPVNAPSMTLILTFSPNQAWSWLSANLYVVDAAGGGATG